MENHYPTANSQDAAAAFWRPRVPPEVHRLLRHGEITRCELVPWGSNYTYCVELRIDGQQGLGIYKPRRGERPLWDFPEGTLYCREYAAFLAAEALGWTFVPPTVIRSGPHGMGSMQLFVESEPPRSLSELQSDDLELARIAAFDFVANNADRKAGHILRDAQGKLWGIDQGLCFNLPPKVRTVLLHLYGQPVPESVLAEMAAFWLNRAHVERVSAALRGVIDCDEVEAFFHRIEWLLERGVYPSLNPYRSVPWPPF